MSRFLHVVPGAFVRWEGIRLQVIDVENFETLLAREPGKRRLKRVPVAEAVLDRGTAPSSPRPIPELTSIDESAWREATRRFEVIEPLLGLPQTNGNYELVKSVADQLNKHPSTVYRWISLYRKTGRLSVFLRKERSDVGSKRLSQEVEAIIETAVKTQYLNDQQNGIEVLDEEVRMRCAAQGLRAPHVNTLRRRVALISDRLKLEKRISKKAASERFEPLRGRFPGADYPLAVAQIDHTPMDVVVVDEHDRRPIGRPNLTVVIDVFSRMVLGFAIYLEAPSAFTTGLAIAHAVLSKEQWLSDLDVQADWPCWGKMRKIHCDNAKEFRGHVMGRACVEHDITVEHRPRGQPRYGGHVERGFRTFMRRVHQLKGTTFSNIQQKGEYDSEGKAVMTRREVERWFTFYIAKYYPNKYHYGIKTTPYAKYQEGLFGTDTRLGIGLPESVPDPKRFMLDFMPFRYRSVQEYGLLIDHVHYYDDALRPYIHATDPDNSRKARLFLVRIIPRDMRCVYFWDPEASTYIEIPYRDRSRPVVSRWEIVAAEARLKTAGRSAVNESLIFEAIQEMREIEEAAQRKTKSMRRSREQRNHPPKLPATVRRVPSPEAAAAVAGGPEPVSSYQPVEPFDGIVEPD